LPLHDLAHSIPGVVLAALLPGFALATLLAPGWRAWQRLTMAPGLSAGFIGIAGLAMHDVHVPFEPLTIFPALIVLGVAAVIRWRRHEPGPPDDAPWWLPLPALLAGALGAAIFVWALHGQLLPPDWDTATHGGLANQIAQSHNVLPLIPIPLEATEFVRPRPGFEAMSAVVSWLGAPSPAEAMGPVIAMTLVLMPLSLALLVFETTGSIVLTAIVPFFALGLAFPSDQAIIGRFPEVVDSTLIVPFIVASLRVIRGRSTLENAVLIVGIAASIWVIHGLELVTALVVGCGLYAVAVFTMLRASWRAAILRIGLVVGTTLVGAALVTLLTRLPHVPPPSHVQPSQIVVATASQPLKFHHILLTIAETDLTSPVALALYVIGVIAVLVRRRMLWVLLAQVVLVVMMVDDLFLHRFSWFWRVVYPWGDTDRILGVQYWLLPLVLGAGLLSLVDVMRRLSRTRRLWVAASIAAVAVVAIAFIGRHALGRVWTYVISTNTVYLYPLGAFNRLAQLRPWILTMAVAAIVVVVAWLAFARHVDVPGVVHRRMGAIAQHLDAGAAVLGVLAIICLVVGAATELGVYRNEINTRSLVSPADVAVLQRMQQVLPKHAIVMSDGGDDAGMWMAGLTTMTPLVPNGFAWGSLDTPLDVAVSHACTDPAGAQAAISQAQTDAVFIGALNIAAPLYPWNVNCIARLPDLRLIASAPWHGNTAAGFAVVK
jgi:hypothetical protein